MRGQEAGYLRWHPLAWPVVFVWRWRVQAGRVRAAALAVSAPHLVALVRDGVTFVNGKLAGRPGEDAPPEAA